ncbi:MAG: MBL fold metallo-hydrolase [Pseudomonadota bacterium]
MRSNTEKTVTTARITILVDNDVRPGLGLEPEHGFAALLEQGPVRVLFDTGQGPALENNACRLGIDLTRLSAVVLSHGHYDHTGGLLQTAVLNGRVRVVGHPGIFSRHLKMGSADIEARKIGCPFSKELLERTGAVFDFVDGFVEILPGFWFTGFVPRVFETKADTWLVTREGGFTVPDPLPDDCSAVISTPSGYILLLGCAHSGVRNVLEHVCTKLGTERIFGIIGGTHLGMSDEWETEAAIEAFERFGVSFLAPCHCTGPGPRDRLKAHFGPRFHDAAAGAVFEF